jgi:hypothetical protein
LQIRACTPGQQHFSFHLAHLNDLLHGLTCAWGRFLIPLPARVHNGMI